MRTAAAVLLLVAAAHGCDHDSDCGDGMKCCTPLDSFNSTSQCYDPKTSVCVGCNGAGSVSMVCPNAKPSCCHIAPAVGGATCYDPKTEDCVGCGAGIQKPCPGPGAGCCFQQGCYNTSAGLCCGNSCGGSGAGYCAGAGSKCCGSCGACASGDKEEKCCSDPQDPSRYAWACPKSATCGTFRGQQCL